MNIINVINQAKAYLKGTFFAAFSVKVVSADVEEGQVDAISEHS